jgi:hypothetical protein
MFRGIGVADLPRCPNFLERSCERSELVLLKETDQVRHFFCRNCKLDWVVSRSKVKAQAADELQRDRIRKATPTEQRQVFGRYYTGARRG